jgi:predicted TIM-barrel fold metal-dependent hydrolase
MKRCFGGRTMRILSLIVLGSSGACVAPATPQSKETYEFNDAHVHLTNNIQEGPSIRELLEMMGRTVGRAAVFGIPLQQQWSYAVDKDRAPTYYLHSDAPLYYYSFVDARIAMAYKSLTKEQQQRFEPMITGFNPADMYAVDHIRRVLQTFPGVFTGIGEFTIHKEFVAGKIPGETASLGNPALDRILDFAEQSGLVVLLHNDVDIPFAKSDSQPAYLDEVKALFRRHRRATIIWAHMGLGRTVAPSKNYFALMDQMLSDPELSNVYVDISWDQAAKYLVASAEATRQTAELMRHHADRFLFGTDASAAPTQADYLKTYGVYDPLWNILDRETSRKVRLANFERIFDNSRRRVRAWESVHLDDSARATW